MDITQCILNYTRVDELSLRSTNLLLLLVVPDVAFDFQLDGDLVSVEDHEPRRDQEGDGEPAPEGQLEQPDQHPRTSSAGHNGSIQVWLDASLPILEGSSSSSLSEKVGIPNSRVSIYILLTPAP